MGSDSETVGHRRCRGFRGVVGRSDGGVGGRRGWKKAIGTGGNGLISIMKSVALACAGAKSVHVIRLVPKVAYSVAFLANSFWDTTSHSFKLKYIVTRTRSDARIVAAL